MGTLYYVIGPSGAGKDSVMAYVRSRLGPSDRFVFAHRYITRPREAGGEDHVALSASEFATRSDLGLFCMEWRSHGLRYGIGIEIKQWLERGCGVVVNGSRGYLKVAQERFPTLAPVLIEVSPDRLRERLEKRGRESRAEIEERIRRATSFEVEAPNLVRLSNDGPLERAGERFLDLLRPAEVAPAKR